MLLLDRRTIRRLSGLTLAIAWATIETLGRAQGVPVFDQSAIAAAQQNLTTLQKQLQQLSALVQTAQSLSATVGASGPPKINFQSTLGDSGISQFSNALTTSMSGGNGSNLASILQKLGQQKGQASGLTADFSNFSSAQQWVSATLTTAPNDNASVKALGRQARALIAGEAAADGYALALTARRQISQMETRTQALANQVTSAMTLRDDVAANTAVILAVHDEMAEIQALLAALLSIEAIDQLVDSDDSTTLSAATVTQ